MTGSFLRRVALLAGHGTGLNFLLRRRRRQPLAIMYHGVTNNQPCDVAYSRHVLVDEFDRQLRMLKRQFTIISAAEWVEAVRRGTMDGRLLTLTFDDGYRNNLLTAVPVLKAHGLAACFFVTTGPISRGEWLDHDLVEIAMLYGQPRCERIRIRHLEVALSSGSLPERVARLGGIERQLSTLDWNSYVAFARQLFKALDSPAPPAEFAPQFALLTPTDVGQLVAEGMEIGSHTVDHVRLGECNAEEIRYQLTQAARHIEQWTGVPAARQLLAYPQGSYDLRVIESACAVGHRAAFAVIPNGPLNRPLYELPRLGLSRGDGILSASAKISGLIGLLRMLRGVR